MIQDARPRTGAVREKNLIESSTPPWPHRSAALWPAPISSPSASDRQLVEHARWPPSPRPASRSATSLKIRTADPEDGAPVAVMANLKGKGHELKTVQKLLRSPEVNLSGGVVTADSLHCQDQTAHLITPEKGADYVLQVQGNQPTLQAYAPGQLAGATPLFRPPAAATGDRNCANYPPSPRTPPPATSPRLTA